MDLKISNKKKSEDEIYELLLFLNNSYIPPLSDQVDLRNYTKKIHNKAKFYFLEDDKNCVGIIAYYLSNKKCYITSIGLQSKYHNHGYGSMFFDFFIAKMSEKSISQIKLEVHSENKKALSFYKKYNFKFVKQKKNNSIIAFRTL